MLKYDEYLSHGVPMATGVIEEGCRHLVNDRMAITGARWGLQRAEAILKLRSLRSSGDFDEYLEYHKSQARQAITLRNANILRSRSQLEPWLKRAAPVLLRFMHACRGPAPKILAHYSG